MGGDGKDMYGESYADVWAINRLHYLAVSPKECDHVSKKWRIALPDLAFVGAVLRLGCSSGSDWLAFGSNAALCCGEQ